jgi:hypothetical protein
MMAPRYQEAIEALVGKDDDGPPIYCRGSYRQEIPARYWFYNGEPLHARFRDDYREAMDGAERVFDYSERNADVYPRSEFCPLILGDVPEPVGAENCDVLVLFYGLLTERRRAIMEQLIGTVRGPVVVTDGHYWDDLVRWIRRARVVLCLNAWDDISANPCRAFPMLECGGRLLCERTQEDWFNDVVAEHAPVVPFDEFVPRAIEMVGGQP